MANKQHTFTDADLDNLISSVDAELSKAEKLAKSAALKKAAPPAPDEDAPPADAGAPADAAPAADAGASAPPADAAMADAGAPPADAAPAADAGAGAPPADAAGAPPADGSEQGLEGEQGGDAPLSDDELNEIYGSMQPQELERHFMVIRQHLESAYAGGQQQDAGAQPPQQAAPQAAPQAPPAPAGMEMGKSEDLAKSENVSLKQKLADQEIAITNLTKAFEALAKPQRKAVTDLEFIKKSDTEDQSSRELSKEEIREAYGKIGPAALSKGERDLVSDYFLHNTKKREVEQLIQSKGGKS
jgi:hypothetical protein